MKELMKAIHNHYDTSLIFKPMLASDAFYYGRGKQDDNLPYCVYTAGETSNENTHSSVISGIPIQMNIYTRSSTTPGECFDVLEACRELFENQVLTVTDYYNVLFDKIIEVPPMSVSDGTKWMAVIEFNCLLQKREVLP